VPVSIRKEAARHPILAAHLRRELALATWIEAVLLDQVSIAQELAGVVAEQVPELKPYLDAYVAAPGNDAKKFAAVYLMLKYPGTRPYVDEGLGRPTPLHQIGQLPEQLVVCAEGKGNSRGGWQPTSRPPPKGGA